MSEIQTDDNVDNEETKNDSQPANLQNCSCLGSDKDGDDDQAQDSEDDVEEW